jgi:hypothetical protein
MTPEQRLLVDNFMRQTGLTAADILNYLSDRETEKFFADSIRTFEETVLDPRDLSS